MSSEIIPLSQPSSFPNNFQAELQSLNAKIDKLDSIANAFFKKDLINNLNALEFWLMEKEQQIKANISLSSNTQIQMLDSLKQSLSKIKNIKTKFFSNQETATEILESIFSSFFFGMLRINSR